MTFRLLLRSCSSPRTLAVSIAVEEFLMPLEATNVAVVGALLSERLVDAESGVEVPDIDAVLGFDADTSDDPVSLVVAVSLFPFFFRFLDPGAFFSECVKPSSDNFWALVASCSLSEGFVGRMGMIFSGSYDSLHCKALSVTVYFSL